MREDHDPVMPGGTNPLDGKVQLFEIRGEIDGVPGNVTVPQGATISPQVDGEKVITTLREMFRDMVLEKVIDESVNIEHRALRVDWRRRMYQRRDFIVAKVQRFRRVHAHVPASRSSFRSG